MNRRTDATGDDNRHPPIFWQGPKNQCEATSHNVAVKCVKCTMRCSRMYERPKIDVNTHM